MDPIIMYLIVAAVVLVGFAVFYIFQKEKAKTVLYALMLQAKSLAKDKILESGADQENWVFEKAKIFLPPIIRKFISDEALLALIRFLFKKAKDYLDDGQFNGTDGTAK